MKGKQSDIMNTRPKYALLQAANDSDYVKKMYGGYLNVFVAAFGEEGEEWELYTVVEGQFPDMNELERYEGFIVSGSPFDAYGDEFWILKLCILLKTLDMMQKKVLGICFGHQVICRALGGKVGRSPTGWDIGLRETRIIKREIISSLLNLEESIYEIVPETLTIIECHQDEVWEMLKPRL